MVPKHKDGTSYDKTSRTMMRELHAAVRVTPGSGRGIVTHTYRHFGKLLQMAKVCESRNLQRTLCSAVGVMVGSLKIAPMRAPAATASFRTFLLDVLAVPLLTNIVQHICIVFRTTFFLKDGAPPFSARGSLPAEKQKTTQNQNMSINLLSYSSTSLHRAITKK